MCAMASPEIPEVPIVSERCLVEPSEKRKARGSLCLIVGCQRTEKIWKPGWTHDPREVSSWGQAI
jgi:hypothetical protein